MLDTDFIAHWKQEESRPMTGWDFSYLAGRRHAPFSLAGRRAGDEGDHRPLTPPGRWFSILQKELAR
jgi:hypothetical protein